MSYWKYIGMDVEMWNTKSTGVLFAPSLFLRASHEGVFGEMETYGTGSVCRSMFTFLCGRPDTDYFSSHAGQLRGSWIVCTSAEWEEYLRRQPLEIVMRRMMMEPMSKASVKTLAALPEGYTVSAYTPEIFERHPFGHGTRYGSFEDFSLRGSGAVVLYGDEVAASASSFLTVGSDVELDVSTAPAHRRKGLADHCVAMMLADCASRGLAVHWDAQNTASYRLAVSHGFAFAQDYAVYVLE